MTVLNVVIGGQKGEAGVPPLPPPLWRAVAVVVGGVDLLLPLGCLTDYVQMMDGIKEEQDEG